MHIIGSSKFDVLSWPSADGRFQASELTPVFHYCSTHATASYFSESWINKVETDLSGVMIILTYLYVETYTTSVSNDDHNLFQLETFST